MDVLLSLSIPALSEKYDMLIPDFLTVRDMIPLIIKAVEDLSERRYHASGCEVLCGEFGILNPQLTLNQHNIKNGAKMWLI